MYMHIKRFINNDSLKGLLGQKIYYRALDYYRAGNIQEYKQTQDRIVAEVQGSGFLVYRVKIGFDKGYITEAYCNCPYYGLFKHIGAVFYPCLKFRSHKGFRRDYQRFIKS